MILVSVLGNGFRGGFLFRFFLGFVFLFRVGFILVIDIYYVEMVRERFKIVIFFYN